MRKEPGETNAGDFQPGPIDASSKQENHPTMSHPAAPRRLDTEQATKEAIMGLELNIFHATASAQSERAARLAV